MSITTTVPLNNPMALRAVAEMYATLARHPEGVVYADPGALVDLPSNVHTPLDPAVIAGIEAGGIPSPGVSIPGTLETLDAEPPASALLATAALGAGGEPYTTAATAFTAPQCNTVTGIATQPLDTGAPVTFTPPANGVELDTAGMPWDARINNKGRTKRADGTWKLAKGVDKGLVEQVRAELRAVQAIPATTAPPAPPATTAPPAPATTAPPAPPATTAPPAPPATTAPPAPPAGVPTTYADFITFITVKQAAGLLAVTEVVSAVQSIGLPSLPLLASREDLIPAVYAALEPIWTARTPH